jgi:hypothetical protein
MTELLPGNLAPTTADAEAPPPRPFRIRDSGRLDPDPAQWARPLPPLLWQRLDAEQRQAHERAVAAYAEAHGKARELAAKARQAALDDEQALRKAVSEGGKPPKPKAPALEQAAAEAQRAEEMAAVLVLESGRALAERLSDDDLEAVISEAKQQSAAIVATIPELVDRMLEELQEAGRLGAQAAWAGRLRERRIQAPWRPSSQPVSQRLSAAVQHAAELKTYAQAETSEREWKASGPPQHHAPPGAPPAGSWVAGKPDPTR